MPKEWVDGNQIDLNVDVSKVVTTSHLSSTIRPDPVLPENILSAIRGKTEKGGKLQGYGEGPKYVQVPGNSSAVSGSIISSFSR